MRRALSEGLRDVPGNGLIEEESEEGRVARESLYRAETSF